MTLVNGLISLAAGTVLGLGFFLSVVSYVQFIIRTGKASWGFARKPVVVFSEILTRPFAVIDWYSFTRGLYAGALSVGLLVVLALLPRFSLIRPDPMLVGLAVVVGVAGGISGLAIGLTGGGSGWLPQRYRAILETHFWRPAEA